MRPMLIAMTLGLFFVVGCDGGKEAQPLGYKNDGADLVSSHEINILCTTFPIYQFTCNIIAGRGEVSIELMLPAQLGCPHDYALTPRDMRKLSSADVLVVNGGGLEQFMGAPIRDANRKLIIIDSSHEINEILQYSNGQPCEHEGHIHGHSTVNPHLFASPRMAAKLVVNIATQLSRVDPLGAETYMFNAKNYAEKMNMLADEMAALGASLTNNRIVISHGVFDYLARDMSLDVVGVMQAHGQEPSAAEMLALVDSIREKKVGAVFYEPQYSEKIGLVLAKETGVKVGMLDPVATGPENAPLDYYEIVMRRNMRAIEDTLRVRP